MTGRLTVRLSQSPQGLTDVFVARQEPPQQIMSLCTSLFPGTACWHLHEPVLRYSRWRDRSSGTTAVVNDDGKDDGVNVNFTARFLFIMQGRSGSLCG